MLIRDYIFILLFCCLVIVSFATAKKPETDLDNNIIIEEKVVDNRPAFLYFVTSEQDTIKLEIEYNKEDCDSANFIWYSTDTTLNFEEMMCEFINYMKRR